MDLSFLIPSKMRRRLLDYFTIDPDAQVYVNELARELKAAPQPVYRELINLENWGFLFSSKRGNQRVFRVNKRFIFFKPIAEMLENYRKERGRTYTVAAVYDLKSMIREQKNKPVPESLKAGLLKPRRRPRSYDEEILLNGKSE